jgi:AbrB family looped-hinge helix DNA binding protein
MNKKTFNLDRQFYGSTTLGEKGQAVIPSEARKAMKLKKGEKLLVFGMGENLLALSKVSHLDKFASHLSEMAKQLKMLRKTLKRSPKK